MKKKFISVILILIAQSVFSQTKITLADIWLKYAYSSNGFYGWNSMNDGLHYTIKEGNKIVRYDYNTNSIQQEWQFKIGEKNLEFDSYQFSADEKKILLSAESEPIYRHSTLDKNYIYDINNDRLFELDEGGKQQNAAFSSDGKQIAYIKNNNLFIKNIENLQLTQITTDGLKHHIINGAADWVYEEEFAIIRAFEWSPDGKQLMYLRFDETEVPMFEMAMYEGRLYPEDYTFKYPKVGEHNSIVTLQTYHVTDGKTEEIHFDASFEYIPRIGYTPDGG
ncbi:MAG: DPP IV N-terminal domain-containing protein, partial [Flavobacteriales bacterium]|nr:DPP IV N-terminal domain-containing protein [Flavobacteriales bacterium]